MVPDTLGLNGFCGRVTLLTHPLIPEQRKSDFNGKVKWVGVTCNTTYELNGAGPFVHRRVLFKSSIKWPCQLFGSSAENRAGGIEKGDYIRATVANLDDRGFTACLRRLFQRDTVRGVVQGPTASLGVTVLKDETMSMRGSDDGVRKQKKYWNSLKKEPEMQYNILPSGGFDFSLSNSPESQHIYMVDMFSYGLDDLESPLPELARQGAQADTAPKTKRFKSDDTVMSGGSDESFGTSGLMDALTNPMVHEDFKAGRANIITEMKLYYQYG